MKAEILCVGTEILLGDIVNTNAAYIARELAAIGIDTYHQSVVGDNPGRLKDSLNIAFSRADLVVMTGGLGPTFDDLTKETVANYFGLKMVWNDEALEKLEAFFKLRGVVMTENNKKQAMMPEGATVFQNEHGTAPGLAVSKDGKTAILLPGPPREMMPMFKNQAEPYLMQKSNRVLKSHTIKMIGIGESTMEDMLHDYMLEHTNPTLAPYAKEGECMLRVTAAAPTKEEADELIAPVIEDVKQLLDKYIYGIDVETIEEALVTELKQKGLTVAVAESLTGGMIAKRITDIAGSSNVFGFGVCTYSNDMKETVLGVKEDTLKKYGAVSEQTAREMAEGCRRVSGADIAISTTGIAGPDGGSDEKPVGLVYIGVCCDKKTEVYKFNFANGRRDARFMIRLMSASNAIWAALKAARLY